MVSGSETGVVLPYEKCAIAGGELPEGLAVQDQWLFLSLRLLYGQKRLGIIDRATAVREKKKLLESHRHMAFQNEVMESLVRKWKDMELAASDYRKAPSVEKADRILEIIYGAKRKEQA